MVCNWNRTEWDIRGFPLHRFELTLEEWTLACAPVSIVLNAIVLYIAFRYVKIRDRLNQCFVVMMTVADLAHAVGYMSTKHYVQCFPRAICGVYYFVNWLSQMLSVLALVFLNVDKCIYVAIPLRYHAIVTPRVVAAEIFGACVLSLSTCFLTYYGFSEYSEQYEGLTECKLNVKRHYYAILTILFYIVPTLVCVAISFYIFGVSQKWMRDDARRRTAARRHRTSTATDRLMHEEGVESSAMDPRKLFKRIFFVFSSTVFTSATVLPYRVSLSICQFECSISLVDTIYVLWFLLPMNAVLNPIITMVTQKHYRDGLRKIFGACGAPCRRQMPEGSLETQVFRLL